MRFRLIIRRHGLLLPIYLLIALLFTYPTVLHLTTAIGGQQDALENYWNLWWTGQAVFKLHQNPFHAPWMHYPFGLPLYFHTYNSLNALLSLPIQACCGVAAAYNLLNLFAFTVAGVGMYALVYYVTRVRAAAFIAGLIYAFSPYMAYHLYVGQPFMLSLEWTPFYLLALLAGLRERWWALPLASLAMMLIGMTDFHYLAYAAVITALVAIYEMLRVRNARAIAGLVGKLAIVTVLAAIFLAPVLVPTILELRSEPYARRPLAHSVVHSTDLAAFFLPSIFHPLWGEWASGIFYDRLVRSFIIGGMGTLGYVALALALIGLLCDRRRAGLFALLFGCFFVLALGPYLQVYGVNKFGATQWQIPLPYILFRELPFMDIPRIPSRFVAAVMLGLAALAGVGVAWLWQRPFVTRQTAWRRNALCGALAILVLFEYWPQPFRETQITADQVSPFFRQLGADGEQYAILEVPYLWKPSMFNQTYHGKPTVGGRISREKSHPWAGTRFFGPLLRGQPAKEEIGLDNSATAWRAAMTCENVRYVVFYKQGPGVDKQELKDAAALQKVLFSGEKPVFEDDTLRAFGPIRDVPKEPYWTPAPDEWHDAEARGDGVVYRWADGNHGGLLIYPCGQREVTLRFSAHSYATPRTLDVQFNGQSLGHFALKPDLETSIEVPLTLADGENRVDLRSLEGSTSPAALGASDDTRQLSFAVSQVVAARR